SLELALNRLSATARSARVAALGSRRGNHRSRAARRSPRVLGAGAPVGRTTGASHSSSQSSPAVVIHTSRNPTGSARSYASGDTGSSGTSVTAASSAGSGPSSDTSRSRSAPTGPVGPGAAFGPGHLG